MHHRPVHHHFHLLGYLSGRPGEIALIAGVFAAAWLCSRLSTRLAARVVRRYEKRHLDVDGASTGVLLNLKRRDTAISLVRTSVRYAAYGLAAFIAFIELAGRTSAATVAGASLVVLLLGFALQRFLIDILSGTFMFFENWFDVGDSISLEPWGIAGIVDEVSLRSTRLRTVGGDIVRINNSAIIATRLLPRGVRRVSVELFTSSAVAGRELVEEVALVMPVGPTNFASRPVIDDIRQLDDELFHVIAHASVAPGREWLAHEFLPQVLKEHAAEGVIVHGPVVMDIDRQAEVSYARSRGLSFGEPDAPPTHRSAWSRLRRR